VYKKSVVGGKKIFSPPPKNLLEKLRAHLITKAGRRCLGNVGSLNQERPLVLPAVKAC